MSTTKRDQQPHSLLVPLLVTTEAKTEHQPAALTVNYAVQQNIQTPNRQKQTLSFCPNCKMLLRTAVSNPSSLRCKKCGYKAQLEHAILLDAKHSHQPVNEIAVIDKEKASLRTHAVVQAICEKCGKPESETWTIAVGSEGSVSSWVFLKCVHCGFIRREVG